MKSSPCLCLARDDSQLLPSVLDLADSNIARKPWLQPTLSPHSTMTTVTQAAVPGPLMLLFLDASTTQCFSPDGPIQCPQ